MLMFISFRTTVNEWIKLGEQETYDENEKIM